MCILKARIFKRGEWLVIYFIFIYLNSILYYPAVRKSITELQAAGMLSYMIPVEEKPPPVPNKNHLQLQLELQQQQQQQQQQQNNQHHNHVGPASSPLPTVHPESDGRKVIIKTPAGGVKTTLSSESSVSSISSSDVASSTTMTPTDKPKPKLLVNGTKHASLKRWANLPYTLHVLVVSVGGLWGILCQERNTVVGWFCCNVLNANRDY